MIKELAQNAAKAAKVLAVLDEKTKNQVLQDMADALRTNAEVIYAANKMDLAQAEKDGLGAAMIDRLTLNEERVESMAAGIETIVSLPDPAGLERVVGERPNGLKISKMRIPLGVVCMIYEARPNVTADAGALCFKSGNGVILRGGKEALGSSKAIAAVLQDVLQKHNLPVELITVVPDPDRELMMELMQQDEYIDVIIPRGGEGLIRHVSANSKIPLAAAALQSKQVKINASAKAAGYFENPTVIEDDAFGEEYLDLEIAVGIVDDLDAAFEHISRFGSHHTEVICTKNELTAKRFQRTVDASVVMVNASSRFSDGSELGLGAEIGIATTKLHAYGPMGLESLTAEKYLVSGTGQVRA